MPSPIPKPSISVESLTSTPISNGKTSSRKSLLGKKMSKCLRGKLYKSLNQLNLQKVFCFSQFKVISLSDSATFNGYLKSDIKSFLDRNPHDNDGGDKSSDNDDTIIDDEDGNNSLVLDSLPGNNKNQMIYNNSLAPR
jgi:hypothetical protein